MLLALGYHLTFDPQYTSNHRLKTLKLPNKSVSSFDLESYIVVRRRPTVSFALTLSAII